MGFDWIQDEFAKFIDVDFSNINQIGNFMSLTLIFDGGVAACEKAQALGLEGRLGIFWNGYWDVGDFQWDYWKRC